MAAWLQRIGGCAISCTCDDVLAALYSRAPRNANALGKLAERLRKPRGEKAP